MIDKPKEDDSDNLQKILGIISDKSKSRQIVPFLGAGISISAGFPTIKLVAEYLAKVHFAIYFGVYEDRFPDLDDGHKAGDTYRQHPSKYLEDFGWPNIGQLNADLWAWLGRGIDENKNENKETKSQEEIERFISDIKNKYFKDVNCNNNKEITDEIRIWINQGFNEKNKDKDDQNEIKKFNGHGRKKIWDKDSEQANKEFPDNNIVKLDYLSNDITPIQSTDSSIPIQNLDFRDHLKAIVQWTLRKELAERESGTMQAMIDEWLRWKNYYFDDTNGEEPGLLYGDWEVLLDRLCEGNFNLADALFTSFEQGLKPTLSHRYLAFLQPKLGIPLILTTNFDSFLEQAFHDEGVPPKVFDVHRDAELPHAPLVSRQLSLLKLHGSSYGLRLGERLKYPLETDARINTLNYIPQDALILVMGFSGSERRIMQMLQAIAKDESLGTTNPRLIWIQGPGKESNFFKELKNISGDRVETCKIQHLDSFLQEVYFYIANTYQSSPSGYLTFPNIPYPQKLAFEINPIGEEYKKEHKRLPVHICISKENEHNKFPASWATLAGMAFTKSLGNDYTVIWIDLENHHTVEGIIAEFFDRVRVVDSKAPSCAVSNLNTKCTNDTVNKEAIEKIVKRIGEVFQRGRYVLVLDSVEAFARPQMVHHAIPSSYYVDLVTEFQERIRSFGNFLKALLRIEDVGENSKEYYFDSHVVVTIAQPHTRHKDTDPAEGILALVRKNLIDPFEEHKVTKCNHIYVHAFKSGCNKEKISDTLTKPGAKLEKHWGGNSINYQVNELCKFINSEQLIDSQRKELSNTINKVLDIEKTINLPHGNENTINNESFLVDSIKNQYQNEPDKLKTLLQDVKVKMEDSYPLNYYDEKGKWRNSMLRARDAIVLLEKLRNPDKNIGNYSDPHIINHKAA